MNDLSGKLILVNAILQRSTSIHEQMFKPSFKEPRTFRESSKRSISLRILKTLEFSQTNPKRIHVSKDLGEQNSVFVDYVAALLRAIEKLRDLCGRLLARSKGSDYSMDGVQI